MAIIIGIFVGFILGSFISSNTRSIKPVITFTAVGLVIGVVLSGIRIIPAGNVGVVDLFGRVSDRYLNSGLNIVNPLARVINLSTRTHEDKEQMTVPSKEGLNVQLEVSVLYRLRPDKAVEIYKTVGPHYQEVILIPQYRAVARDVTIGYEAKALYTSEREVLVQKFQKFLQNLEDERGLIIEKVLLRSITLPQTVSAAIEQKLKAEQEAERMKFVLDREKIEADRKRVEAQGIRDAQAIINESLTAQYLHYLWINTLNLNPNVIYVATEANMPIFRTISDGKDFKKEPLKEQK